MNSPGEKASDEPRSTLSIAIPATLAAAILVLTLFLLVWGFQWKAALADLRAEPGIEILSIERYGFFRKRLLGLRDPLAPSPEEILRRHNIGPRSAELILTEYHSLNTPYALEREETRGKALEKVKEDLIAAIAAHTHKLNARRDADLEKITRMLFDTKFPEEMKSVDIEWLEGQWIVEGELYEPIHSRFVEAAPANIIEGELDFSGLVNLTETRTHSLGERIGTTNLLTTDLDGEFTHVDQVIRLLADYDEVCEISRIPLPRLRLEIISPDEREDDLRIASLWKELTVDGEIDPDRFEDTILILPGETGDPDSTEDEDLLAFLKLLPEAE